MSRVDGQPLEVPFREVEHDLPDEEFLEGFDYLIGVGHAKFDLAAAEISRTTKRKWAREDRERDRRRIPIGFRAPEVLE